MTDQVERYQRTQQSLAGLSVGDAFGQQSFYAPELVLLNQLPPPRWHYTDDTVMARCIVSVLEECQEVNQDRLATEFALEHSAEPNRGYGGTVRRVLYRIHNGENWREVAPSVFNGQGSMGNGGAMRVAPVGAYFADDFDAAVEHARRSAEVTHAHPDGQAGAIAVAVAAAQAWQLAQRGELDNGKSLIETAIALTPDSPTRDGLQHALTIPLTADVRTAAAALGNGSKIIASDTVPFCLWCAARHLDSYTEALWTTVSALSDRDTTCAIVGGIVVMATGKSGIPDEWLLSREPL